MRNNGNRKDEHTTVVAMDEKQFRYLVSLMEEANGCIRDMRKTINRIKYDLKDVKSNM